MKLNTDAINNNQDDAINNLAMALVPSSGRAMIPNLGSGINLMLTWSRYKEPGVGYDIGMSGLKHLNKHIHS